MMCWSWIDSSRKREALTISCPGPGIASLRRCKAGPGQKIAKTTPCKVEWTPARSTLAALRPGQEKKGPNLISSRSRTRGKLIRCGRKPQCSRSYRRGGLVQYTFCHLKTKDSDNQQIGLARRLSRDQLQAKNHTHPREAG